MKIIIHSINYAPELISTGKFTGEMAAYLAGRGHQVRAVAAPPFYPAWRVDPAYREGARNDEMLEGVRVFRAPLWVPGRQTTIRRLLHLISFSLSSLPVLLAQIRWRPDVIICVVPTLFSAPVTLLAARLSGACAWLHVQDFEVDAMFGLDMAGTRGRRSLLRRLGEWFERHCVRRFDRVSTISPAMLVRAREKGVPEESLVFFPNWVDTVRISPDADRARFRKEWAVTDNQCLVLYSGNMGEKQGLTTVLAAAEKLMPERHIRFVLAGGGAVAAQLMERARRMGLTNLHFAPLCPEADLPEMLRAADLHLVTQRRGAADVVYPSKLTAILAAGGHALIGAEPDTALGRLVADHPGIATRVTPEDADELASVILSEAQPLIRRRGRPNKVARAYAEQYLDRDAVLGRFAAALQEGVSATGVSVFSRELRA